MVANMLAITTTRFATYETFALKPWVSCLIERLNEVCVPTVFLGNRTLHFDAKAICSHAVPPSKSFAQARGILVL
jgi:hypothetical protein